MRNWILQAGALLALVVALPAAGAPLAAGPEVDVSNLPGVQSEANISVDPSNSQVLLAASNSVREGTMRLYSSTDGGATWTTTTAYPAPKRLADACAADPWTGIDLTGRQYFSFLRSSPCRKAPARLYVITRSGPNAPWSRPVLVARLGRARFDDKPALAVDTSQASEHANRVYLAWSRVSRLGVFSIVLSRSDDGGRTWSRPVKVNRTGREESYASIAVSRSGLVYVVWDDITNFHVNIARSTDGGAHFGREHAVTAFTIVTIPHCGSGIVIPALRLTCVHANPIVTVDTSTGPYAGRVYVTYAQTEFQGDQGTALTTFDPELRALAGYPVSGRGFALAPTPEGQDADQFWPQSAVDPSTGALWACFYDTRGDPRRTSAYYSCTVSTDGGRTWAPPVHAATVASDETQPGADPREYGDYEGLAVANGVAHPIWTDSRDLGTLREEIYTTALSETDLKPPAPSG
jgi:hypothetical protein